MVASENGDLNRCIDLLNEEKRSDLIADIDTRGLDNWTPLHMAASENHISVGKLLIEKDCELDPKSSIGRTPLHVAALRGHQQFVKLLVEADADLNAVDSSSNTPLHYSSEFGHLDCV